MTRSLTEIRKDDERGDDSSRNGLSIAFWDRAQLLALVDELANGLERLAANNDFLFLAEMAEFARETLSKLHEQGSANRGG